MENTHLTMLEDDLADLNRMAADAPNEFDRDHYLKLAKDVALEIRSIRKRSRTGLDPRKVSALALSF